MTAERQKDEVRTMKYTMQELKDIYFEAKDRFGYIEDEDIMGYGNIAKKAERVLTGKTKFCRFNICEKDTISAMFTEDDDACIVNDTYDEYVKRYGNHAELAMKMYGVKKTKAQTAETAVTGTEQEAQEAEQTVETIAEGTSEVETTEQAQAEENKDTFEYRNYIISGNERTGIIAIDNHGNFSPKVYKTIEEAKKAVDEDIEYAEKKYAEMEAEQTEVEETAETETEETIKTTAERQKDEVITMKAKTYKAVVTNKETGKLKVITRDDYTSKKDFAHDLRVNSCRFRR